MSDTVSQDQWVSEYLGLAVPPPPSPPKDLGANRQDVAALKELADQVAQKKAELAKVEKRRQAELAGLSVISGLIGDAFDAAIDNIEADKTMSPQENSRLLEQLEADRAVFAQPFLSETSYAIGSQIPSLTDLEDKVTKLLGVLASSRAEIDETMMEDQKLWADLNPLYDKIEAFARHEVDGVARTARALLDGRGDPRSQAPSGGLDAMLSSGKTSRVVVWIDNAETENASQAESTQSTIDRQSLPEDEKERTRSDYEEGLGYMTAGELQALIDGHRDLLPQFEMDYADDEGKAKVRDWMKGLVLKAQQLLPNAPPDPQQPSEEEVKSAMKEHRSNERTMAREARKQAVKQASAGQAEMAKDFGKVVDKLNEFGDQYEKLSQAQERARADLLESAKRVAGELRIVLASGLPGVAPKMVDKAREELAKTEATFVAIAGGKTVNVGGEWHILNDLNGRYQLALAPELLSESETTLRGIDEADPFSRSYNPPPKWVELVTESGYLVREKRDPLVAVVIEIRTNNPIFEKIRSQLLSVLGGPVSHYHFPPSLLKVLDLTV